MFSSKSFGASNSSSILRSLFAFLQIRISEAHFLVLHYGVRKCAHFIAYAVLSALFFRALRASDVHRMIWKMRYALIALAICLITSSADEIHQTFTPGRTGNWHDVVLDMIGATFVQVAILFVVTTGWAQARWAVVRARGATSNRSAATTARVAER